MKVKWKSIPRPEIRIIYCQHLLISINENKIQTLSRVYWMSPQVVRFFCSRDSCCWVIWSLFRIREIIAWHFGLIKRQFIKWNYHKTRVQLCFADLFILEISYSAKYHNFCLRDLLKIGFLDSMKLISILFLCNLSGIEKLC